MPVIDQITVADCACCGSTPLIDFECVSQSGEVDIVGHAPFGSSSDYVWYRVLTPPYKLINENRYLAGPCPAYDCKGADDSTSVFSITSPYYSARMLYKSETSGCTVGGAGQSRVLFIPSQIYSSADFSESLNYTTATYSTAVGGTELCSPPCGGSVIGYDGGSMTFTLSDPWTHARALAAGSGSNINIRSGPTTGSQCYGMLTSVQVIFSNLKWGPYYVRVTGTTVEYTLTCSDLTVGENYRATVTYRRCTTTGGDFATCSATTFTESFDFTATSTPYYITDEVPMVEDYWTGIVGAAIVKL